MRLENDDRSCGNSSPLRGFPCSTLGRSYFSWLERTKGFNTHPSEGKHCNTSEHRAPGPIESGVAARLFHRSAYCAGRKRRVQSDSVARDDLLRAEDFFPSPCSAGDRPMSGAHGLAGSRARPLSGGCRKYSMTVRFPGPNHLFSTLLLNLRPPCWLCAQSALVIAVQSRQHQDGIVGTPEVASTVGWSRLVWAHRKAGNDCDRTGRSPPGSDALGREWVSA